MKNTHCEFMNLGNGVNAIACGIPDKCDHDSDGPFMYEGKDGNEYTQDQIDKVSAEEAAALPVIGGYATCSKCGKSFYPDYNLF